VRAMEVVSKSADDGSGGRDEQTEAKPVENIRGSQQIELETGPYYGCRRGATNISSGSMAINKNVHTMMRHCKVWTFHPELINSFQPVCILSNKNGNFYYLPSKVGEFPFCLNGASSNCDARILPPSGDGSRLTLGSSNALSFLIGCAAGEMVVVKRCEWEWEWGGRLKGDMPAALR
jgi:hypothetical protein